MVVGPRPAGTYVIAEAAVDIMYCLGKPYIFSLKNFGHLSNKGGGSDVQTSYVFFLEHVSKLFIGTSIYSTNINNMY